jgi:hypothetical protein
MTAGIVNEIKYRKHLLYRPPSSGCAQMASLYLGVLIRQCWCFEVLTPSLDVVTDRSCVVQLWRYIFMTLSWEILEDKTLQKLHSKRHTRSCLQCVLLSTQGRN